MKKCINKAKKIFQLLDSKLKSPSFLKTAFLTFVIVSLIFDVMILGWFQIINQSIYEDSDSQNEMLFKKQLFQMVEGYPIEKMIPYLSYEDKKTAAFIIGVAKKESDWGNHVPVLNGKDCFNYWGYRGQSKRMTWDGYTCFNSPRHAISIISRRFQDLIQNSNLNTPRKMVVWKCGWDCSGHDPESVSKWISDVDYYFKKIYR